eukprot:8878-Pyramimonas_sp.AAC.1
MAQGSHPDQASPLGPCIQRERLHVGRGSKRTQCMSRGCLHSTRWSPPRKPPGKVGAFRNSLIARL